MKGMIERLGKFHLVLKNRSTDSCQKKSWLMTYFVRPTAGAHYRAPVMVIQGDHYAEASGLRIGEKRCIRWLVTSWVTPENAAAQHFQHFTFDYEVVQYWISLIALLKLRHVVIESLEVFHGGWKIEIQLFKYNNLQIYVIISVSNY